MSLRIKINSVFVPGSHPSAHQQIQCTCKLVYGPAKCQQTVGTIRLIKPTASVSWTSRASQKSLFYNSSSTNDIEETGLLSESLIVKTSDENVLVHKLNESDCELRDGHLLEIVCFKLRSSGSRLSKMRPFGKYVMLMDQLKVKSDKNSDGEAFLTIEDYLVDPRDNRILSEKIQFTLHFSQYLNTCNKKYYSIDNKKMKKFINASITPVTTIDFIKTIKKVCSFRVSELIKNWYINSDD